jgi:hypothetical protein
MYKVRQTVDPYQHSEPSMHACMHVGPSQRRVKCESGRGGGGQGQPTEKSRSSSLGQIDEPVVLLDLVYR